MFENKMTKRQVLTEIEKSVLPQMADIIEETKNVIDAPEEILRKKTEYANEIKRTDAQAVKLRVVIEENLAKGKDTSKDLKTLFGLETMSRNKLNAAASFKGFEDRAKVEKRAALVKRNTKLVQILTADDSILAKYQKKVGLLMQQVIAVSQVFEEAIKEFHAVNRMSSDFKMETFFTMGLRELEIRQLMDMEGLLDIWGLSRRAAERYRREADIRVTAEKNTKKKIISIAPVIAALKRGIVEITKFKTLRLPTRGDAVTYVEEKLGMGWPTKHPEVSKVLDAKFPLTENQPNLDPVSIDFENDEKGGRRRVKFAGGIERLAENNYLPSQKELPALLKETVKPEDVKVVNSSDKECSSSKSKETEDEKAIS